MRPCDPPEAALALPASLVETAVRGSRGAGFDSVPEEVPVALVYNGIGHAVMLASPADLEDFGLGFSLSEAILADASELYDLEVEAGPDGVELRLDIAAGRFAALKARRRALAGRTGCGLCGVESLAQAIRMPPALPAAPACPAAALQTALAGLAGAQPLHARTGGTHAAAWANRSGRVLAVREDVGRHNALDKLIGALARARLDPAAGFALVTSRASSEMVLKTATAGIPLLAAVSAPTGYAVRLAQAVGLGLAGFVRPGRHTLYAHPERIAE